MTAQWYRVNCTWSRFGNTEWVVVLVVNERVAAVGEHAAPAASVPKIGERFDPLIWTCERLEP
jgi:hypothetical protein